MFQRLLHKISRFSPLLLIGLLGSGAIGYYFSSDSGFQDTLADPQVDLIFPEPLVPEEVASVAVVRLSEVLPAHPRWLELQSLEDQLAQFQDSSRRIPLNQLATLDNSQLQAALEKQKERLIQDYQHQLAAIEQAKWAQTTEQIERKEAKIKEELHGESSREQARLAQELEQRTAGLQKEYQVKILSLRIKAELSDQGAEERAGLTEQITSYQRELENKLRSLEKEYQDKGVTLGTQLQQKYQRLLDEYTRQVTAATEKELEQERLALEKELRENLERLDQELITPEKSWVDHTTSGVNQPSFTELIQRISTLRGLMLGQIKEVSETCAFREGISTVVLTDNGVFGGIDISAAVKGELAKREGSPSNE